MTTRSERAEAVRKLVREAKHGLLFTHGQEPAGIPYGSLVPVASTGEGLPVVLVSHLAQHTKNLVAEARYVGDFGAAAWPKPGRRQSRTKPTRQAQAGVPVRRASPRQTPESWRPGPTRL